jgi:hypothetical protein
MIEEMLDALAKAGLRLSTLGQLYDGRWQAIITDGRRTWDIGRGATAGDALSAAMEIATTTKPIYGDYSPPKPPRPITAAELAELDI